MKTRISLKYFVNGCRYEYQGVRWDMCLFTLSFWPTAKFLPDWTAILIMKPTGMPGITLACGSYFLEAFVNESDIE